MSTFDGRSTDSPASARRLVPGRLTDAVLSAALIAAAVLNIATLSRYPAPFEDEANMASKAWGLINSGVPFGPLEPPVFAEFAGYWTYFPLLGTWLQSIALRLFGFSLLGLRICSLAFGFMLLVAVFSIGKRLYNTRTGLVAALATSVSNSFLFSAHLARHDIAVAALGFTAIALYLGERQPRSARRGLLAGLAIGLAFELHPNALVFVPVVLLLHVFDSGPRALRYRSLWAFVGGGAIGALIFLALHVLPYPQTYFSLTALAFGATKYPPLVVPDVELWTLSAIGTANLFLSLDLFRVPIAAFAVATLAKRRGASDWRLIVLFLGLLVAMIALVPYKLPHYRILVTPAMDLLIAASLCDFFATTQLSGVRRRFLVYAQITLMTLLIGLALLPPLFAFTLDGATEFGDATDLVRRNVPADSVILGVPTFWLEFRDHPFYAYHSLPYYRRFHPGSTLSDAFAAYHVDYFVTDRSIDWAITDDPLQLPPISRITSTSRSEMSAFLAERGTLVASLDTNAYGTIRVYRISRGE